jgi:hypothetical protein
MKMITTKEIAEILSLLDDSKNLMKLIAVAGDAIDDGCVDDREGALRLLDLGVAIRALSEIIAGKIGEAVAILDRSVGMPEQTQWRKF